MSIINLLKPSTVVLIILLLISLGQVWAEDQGNTESTVYQIRNVEFSIDGNTRESVLMHYLDIERGEEFEGRAAVEEYITDKLQLIRNQRTLANGTITPSFEPDPERPEMVYVDLQIEVSDTWNYIVLPYGKYDSNEGLLLSLRGRNYNFLGGMETLEVNLDYLKPSVEENEYSLNSALKIPFYLYGFEWKFNFEEDVRISADDPTYFYTKAGLSLDIPMNSHTWQASMQQEYYLNEEGDDDPDNWYLRSSGHFGSSIPLGFELPGFTEVNYNPALITSVNYKPGDRLSTERRGYELGVEHGITTGRIDWRKNFRNGAELEFTQNLRWNFQRDRWLSDFNSELQMHKSLGFMGISSRLQGFYRYGGVKEDVAGPIRGILDNRITAESGFFANIDFPIKMWIWFLDRWFEGHISPFFDYGLVQEPGGTYDLGQGWYSAGLEGFAFAKFARSIYLRMSLGIDVEALFDGAFIGDPAPRDGASIYELYIGLGHHY